LDRINTFAFDSVQKYVKSVTDGEIFQNAPTNFSAFTERISQKAIFLKNETTKTLLRAVKTSILEPEKITALSDEACLPRLCFERNLMMEDTL
jgi:3-methyladenine DNA glycosylase AlkC